MPNQPRLVYWDSMVIIHRIQGTPEHIQILRDITDAAERGEVKILLSTYSIAEIVKDPDGGVLSPDQDQKIIDLFENDYFIIRPVTIPIAHLSRQISRKFGIKPKDAVHLATAQFWQVPEFHTYEDKLLSKTGLIGTPPLRIEKPSWTGQLLLLPAQLDTEHPDQTSEQVDSKESNEADVVTAPEQSLEVLASSRNLGTAIFEQSEGGDKNNSEQQETGGKSIEDDSVESNLAGGGVSEHPAIDQNIGISAYIGEPSAEANPPTQV